MGLFDADDEYIEYRRQFEREQQDAAQAQAMAQQAAQGQSQQSQNAFVGTTSGTFQLSNTYDWGSSGLSSYSLGYTSRSRRHSVAENFCYGLNALDPGYIKELVVKETMYMQLLSYFDSNIKKNPDLIKSLQYNTPYGTFLLKNEKYQFDLDKYIEDGPAVEMVEE